MHILKRIKNRRTWRTLAVLLLVLALPISMLSSFSNHQVQAGTQKIWSGGGENDNFSNTANWQDGIIPANGDSLRFTVGNDSPLVDDKRTVTATNDITDLGVTSITFYNGVTEADTTGLIKILGSKVLKIDNGLYANSEANRDLVVNILTPLCITNVVNVANSGSGGSLVKIKDATVQDNNYEHHFNVWQTGHITFEVDGTYSGNVLVNGSTAGKGVLTVNGSVGPGGATNGVTVNGGYFSGNAIVNGSVIIHSIVDGEGVVTSEAKIAPKGGSSQMSITRSLRFDTNRGTVSVRGLQLDERPGLITVNESVVLGSGVNNNVVLEIANDEGSHFIDQEIVIIDNLGTDAITGTFKDLPEGAEIIKDNVKYSISYAGGTDDNDVVLTVIDNAIVTSEKVWTGDGDDTNFSTGDNWEGGIAPSSGDSIKFTVTDEMRTINAVNDILDNDLANDGSPDGFNITSINVNSEVTEDESFGIVNITGTSQLQIDNNIIVNNDTGHPFKLNITAPVYLTGRAVEVINGFSRYTPKLVLDDVYVTNGASLIAQDKIQLVISGTYDGSTTIKADSQLFANGTLGDVNVSGGIVSGNGSVDSLTISNAGTLVADNTRQITINEDLTVGSSGGVIHLPVKKPTTGEALITVIGGVDLGSNCTLSLPTTDSTIYTLDESLLILDNQNTDTNGTFLNLAENSLIDVAPYQFRINYEQGVGSNNIVLTVTDVPDEQYALGITKSPTGIGTVTGAGDYAAGQVVPITATAPAGYQFVNWTTSTSGGSIANSTSASTTYTMPESPATVRANFAVITYALTLSRSPTAGGTVTGAGAYASGATANITATPAAGYQFVNWTTSSGTVASSTSASTTYTMPAANATVTANFEAITYTLTLSRSPTTGGTVTGAGSYATAATANITATPAAGYQFVNWTTSTSGGSIANSTSASTTYTMSPRNATVTANFELLPGNYALTISRSPTAGGTVTGAGAYASGATANITATPAAGYQFVNWTTSSGTVASSTSASTTYTMPAANATVTANFEALTYDLTINRSPVGVGTVTGVGSYSTGQVVPITATPAAGYQFVNWTTSSGGTIADATSASTTYTMPAGDAVIRANFELIEIVIPDDDEDAQEDITIGNGITYVINGLRRNIIINSGGTLKGSGTVGTVAMNSGGSINSGTSPGILNTSNLTYTGGTVTEEIGGTASGEFDQLNVTGTVDLGAGVTNLNITHWNGFAPALNNSFVIVNNDSTDAITGTFAGLAEGATTTVDGYTYAISYIGGTDGNDIVLTVTALPVTPEAPNTGFLATKATPILSALSGLLVVAGLGLIIKKGSLKKN